MLLILIPALPLAAALLTAVLGKRVLAPAQPPARGRWPWPRSCAPACCWSSPCSSATASSGCRHAARRRRPSAIEQGRSRSGPGPTIDPASAAVADVSTARPAVTTTRTGRSATSTSTSSSGPIRSRPSCWPWSRSSRSLVAVYSIGYMHGDPGYWRFFTYIAPVRLLDDHAGLGEQFVLLYVFWEAVGLCSYLLIGFWFEKPAAAAAGKKAFLVNRGGRFRLRPGRVPALDHLRHARFSRHGRRRRGRMPASSARRCCTIRRSTSAAALATAICLLLMLGACGKSAQFPLHVWLPDAMEGPTPVSALIHAATMVTAGVYMVARCTPLFRRLGRRPARGGHHRRLHRAAWPP